MSPRSASLNAEMRERSRAEILAAALRVFAQRGYEASSLTAITTEAGVSHGLAHYYFATKRDLLTEVLRGRLGAVIELVAQLPDDPDKALAILIDAFLGSVAAEPDEQSLTLALMIQPGVREVYATLEAHNDGIMQATEDRLRAIFAARGAEDPALEEIVFRTVLEGVIFKYCVYRGSYPLAAVRRRLYAMWDLSEPPPDDLADPARGSEEEWRLRAWPGDGQP